MGVSKSQSVKLIPIVAKIDPKVPSTSPSKPPPMTTAAMTWNSKPVPVLDGFTKPQRLAYMMPERPASAPEIMNTISVTAFTRMPRKGAAATPKGGKRKTATPGAKARAARQPQVADS